MAQCFFLLRFVVFFLGIFPLHSLSIRMIPFRFISSHRAEHKSLLKRKKKKTTTKAKHKEPKSKNIYHSMLTRIRQCKKKNRIVLFARSPSQPAYVSLCVCVRAPTTTTATEQYLDSCVCISAKQYKKCIRTREKRHNQFCGHETKETEQPSNQLCIFCWKFDIFACWCHDRFVWFSLRFFFCVLPWR